MSVVLKPTLRSIAHKLLDDVLDYAEALAEEWRLADGPGLPESDLLKQAAATKPRITLNEPIPKDAARPVPPPAPRQTREVTIACRSSCGRLEIAVSLSAHVAKRLGFKAHAKAGVVLRDGKLRVRDSKDGRTLFPGGTSGRLWFATAADLFGVAEKHAAESCAFHYDLDDALVIEPPAWLKQAAAKAPSAKPVGQKAKSEPPVSCKKMAGTNPTIKCAACKKATATVECSRCPTLLCDACWDPHVRTHWHAEHKVKASTAARDARHAIRNEA